MFWCTSAPTTWKADAWQLGTSWNKLAGRGAVIQLEGTAGASPAIDRKKGFELEIGQSEVRIVATQTADFQRAKGQTVMENLLQVHHDFQAVYAANDEMMLGAIEALEARQIDASKVVTIGYDAIPDAIAYIQAGRLDATVEQFPGRQARDRPASAWWTSSATARPLPVRKCTSNLS